MIQTQRGGQEASEKMAYAQANRVRSGCARRRVVLDDLERRAGRVWVGISVRGSGSSGVGIARILGAESAQAGRRRRSRGLTTPGPTSTVMHSCINVGVNALGGTYVKVTVGVARDAPRSGAHGERLSMLDVALVNASFNVPRILDDSPARTSARPLVSDLPALVLSVPRKSTLLILRRSALSAHALLLHEIQPHHQYIKN